MNINIREVLLDDYDQIKKLHKQFHLEILNKNDWLKFWSQNPYTLESKTPTPAGWVVEDNNKMRCTNTYKIIFRIAIKLNDNK